MLAAAVAVVVASPVVLGTVAAFVVGVVEATSTVVGAAVEGAVARAGAVDWPVAGIATVGTKAVAITVACVGVVGTRTVDVVEGGGAVAVDVVLAAVVRGCESADAVRGATNGLL